MTESTTTEPPVEPSQQDKDMASMMGDPNRLMQDVVVEDAGPCRKHIKVSVDRKAIDDRFNEKMTELVRDKSTQIDGFRPGRVPRKVLEGRFRTSVMDQIRTEVLMASLEQLATEHKIAPLSPPDLNPDELIIPKEGPFVYEFNVEVRPEFDLPEYRGMKLNRPTQKFTDADIEKEKNRLLESYGKAEPKPGDNPTVEVGDTIMVSAKVSQGDKEMNSFENARLKVEKQLIMNDAVCDNFGDVLTGAKVGETRTVQIKLSNGLSDEAMRGQIVQGRFTINAIQTVTIPALDEAMLAVFNVTTPEQLTERIANVMESRLQYAQRQSARQQILQTITSASTWELPEDMLRKHSTRSLRSRILEMRSSGMSDEQILARRKLLEQDVLKSTADSLKEHFVLQKIAELEKIEIAEEDIDREIEYMAMRSGENPRKVRARMEKEDMLEPLAMELIERRALDIILGSAEYTDIPMNPSEVEDRATSVGQGAEKEAPSPGAY